MLLSERVNSLFGSDPYVVMRYATSLLSTVTAFLVAYGHYSNYLTFIVYISVSPKIGP